MKRPNAPFPSKPKKPKNAEITYSPNHSFTLTTDTQIVDFAPPRYNLVNVVPGQTFTWKVLFWEDEAHTIETDITGDTFDCEIKSIDGTIFVALTSGDGIEQTDTNEITCTIEGAVSANFDHEKTYEYQLNWNAGSSVIPSGYGGIDFLKPIIT